MDFSPRLEVYTQFTTYGVNSSLFHQFYLKCVYLITLLISILDFDDHLKQDSNALFGDWRLCAVKDPHVIATEKPRGLIFAPSLAAE